MLIPRELLAAVLPATDNGHDTRYFLGALQIEPSGRLAATNGHILITAKQETRTSDAEFPIVPGAEYHGDPAGPVLVPSDVAAKLIKATPRKPTIGVLASLQLSQNGSPETATLAATDLQTPTIATIQKPDRTFPDVDRVLKLQENCEPVEVTLAIEVLEAIVRAGKAIMGGQKRGYVTFRVPTAQSHREASMGPVSAAVAFSTPGPDGMTVSGLAMPIRVK